MKSREVARTFCCCPAMSASTASKKSSGGERGGKKANCLGRSLSFPPTFYKTGACRYPLLFVFCYKHFKIYLKRRYRMYDSFSVLSMSDRLLSSIFTFPLILDLAEGSSCAWLKPLNCAC